jgi:hypothetical protein
MLSMWWNRFHECSACDQIRSAYAQCAIKFDPRMLSMDCTHKNCSHFTAGWACAEIRSSYAQHAIKSFPRMLGICMLKFSKNTQKYYIKMQILTINNRNFPKPSRTKVKILKKKNLLIAHPKHVVPRMLSHRRNVRTSKFWRKSKEKKQIFFRKFTKGI